MTLIEGCNGSSIEKSLRVGVGISFDRNGMHITYHRLCFCQMDVVRIDMPFVSNETPTPNLSDFSIQHSLHKYICINFQFRKIV